jgi:hypothetical protein
MGAGKRGEFDRQFEGRDILDGLLEVAGSQLTTDDVLTRFREGAAKGQAASTIIPGLFPEEPRFPDPLYARKLYQNLLGLWDLVSSGKPFALDAPAKTPRVKRPPPVPPAPFGEGGPDEAFVEAAWRYLQDLDKRERDRLLDAFENRQDALLGLLDEQELPESAYACARFLLFELSAMVELGWRPGVRSITRDELKNADDSVPSELKALEAYADEAVAEAELDEEDPLPASEATRVRALARRALGALWQAKHAVN